MITTQTPDLPQTSTQTSQPKDAAAQGAATIEARRAYQAECEAQDRADEDRRRAAEVERSLDDLARECRRLDSEAAAKPTDREVTALARPLTVGGHPPCTPSTEQSGC